MSATLKTTVIMGGVMLSMVFFFQNCQSGNVGLQSPSGDLASASADNTASVEEGTGKEDDKETAQHKVDDEDKCDGSKSDDSYRLLCDRLVSRKLATLANGANVKDTRGNMLFKGDQLGTFSNVRGNLRVLGTAANSSIQEVTDSRGNHIFCGIDVKKISNSVGNIVVVGADVGDISDTVGNIVIIDGKITGNVTNVQGNIRSK
jgi:hypothetical protein